MRLHSIRLHPFGRFIDQSWDLAKPLVVIHGPNELGKTTLRQAIFQALFTPTDVTRTRLDRTVKPWLPLPDGDHAHVTLTFEHEGTRWSLEKRWGAAQMSRLSDGTTAIADPGVVDQRRDPSEVPVGLTEQVLDGRRVGHVGRDGHGFTPLPGDVGHDGQRGVLAAAIVHHHPVSGQRTEARTRSANAARGSGDDQHPARRASCLARCSVHQDRDASTCGLTT